MLDFAGQRITIREVGEGTSAVGVRRRPIRSAREEIWI